MDKPRGRWGSKGLISLFGLYYVAFIGRVLDLRICSRNIIYFLVWFLYFACPTNQTERFNLYVPRAEQKNDKCMPDEFLTLARRLKNCSRQQGLNLSIAQQQPT